MRFFIWVCVATLIAVLCMAFYLYGSGDDDLSDFPIEASLEDFWYASIEYRDDLLAANLYFLEVKAFPGNPFPRIQGGWTETNVHLPIQLRSVAVPRVLQAAEVRNRPHEYVERERQRFDASMDRIWSLVKGNKTLRLGNPRVVGDAVECDVFILIGGTWQDLALLMMTEEHFRPVQTDGSEWDFGSPTVSLLNPNIPK